MTVILIAIQPKKVLVWKKSMEKFGSKEITSTTIKYNNNCALLVDNLMTLLCVHLAMMAPQCFFMERIFPDINNWEITVLKITKVWCTCILPELLARWYTRKQHLEQIDQASQGNSPCVCYCRKQTQGKTVCCSNSKCIFKEFHYECLRISDPIPSKWYCPNFLNFRPRNVKRHQSQPFQRTKTVLISML